MSLEIFPLIIRNICFYFAILQHVLCLCYFQLYQRQKTDISVPVTKGKLCLIMTFPTLADSKTLFYFLPDDFSP